MSDRGEGILALAVAVLMLYAVGVAVLGGQVLASAWAPLSAVLGR